MARTCYVIGCRKGYKSEMKDVSIIIHISPKNAEIMKEWLRRTYRETRLEIYTKVCCRLLQAFFEKNISYQQFLKIPIDLKKGKSQSLKKRHLKADAIPSIFPQVSGHFLENDFSKLISFVDLWSRFKTDEWICKFWAKIETEEQIQFMVLCYWILLCYVS